MVKNYWSNKFYLERLLYYYSLSWLMFKPVSKPRLFFNRLVSVPILTFFTNAHHISFY